jgi:hypothetical protein
MAAVDVRPVALADLEANDPHAPAPKADGETDFLCPLPACADHQNTAQHRSLSANVETGLWECHRCGGRGRLREYWEDRPAERRPPHLRLVTPSTAPATTPGDVVSEKPAVVSKRKVGAVQRFVCVAPDGREAIHCRQNVVLTLSDGSERPDKMMWWESADGRRELPAGLHTVDLLYRPVPACRERQDGRQAPGASPQPPPLRTGCAITTPAGTLRLLGKLGEARF